MSARVPPCRYGKSCTRQDCHFGHGKEANFVRYCKANRDAWVAFVEAQGLKHTGLDPVLHDEATRRQFWRKDAQLAAPVQLKVPALQRHAPFTVSHSPRECGTVPHVVPLAHGGPRGRRPCRFGMGCHRLECYYVHPKDHDPEVAAKAASQEFVLTIRADTNENPADEDMAYCRKHRRAWITFVHAEFSNGKPPQHDPMLHEEHTRRQLGLGPIVALFLLGLSPIVAWIVAWIVARIVASPQLCDMKVKTL
jgi:hypothetical protein